MEQKRTLSSWISARRYIRAFAADYAARHGENAAEIEKDILQAKKINHISLNEYEWVGYHDRTEAQKRTMSTLWTRAEFRKNFTDRRYIAILMNKYIFSKVFSDFYGRRCVQASAVDAALLRALAGDAGKVVYKPNCKGQGTGVRILPAVTEAEQADTLAYLRANSGGIVEEYIQQHPTLAQLNPGAVSIVRFYTVTAPSGMYLFAPVLTTAIEKDISNGCQDALTAMIDIRTGVVITDAVDQNNFIDYRTHPVTGVPFPGLQLPFWAETIDMMRRAIPLASKISNIGWDVTMTADGPLIIEANTMVDMARKQILPAVEGYASELAASLAAKKAVAPNLACAYETGLVTKLSGLTDQIAEKTDELESAVLELKNAENVKEESFAIRDTILGKMAALRAVADEAETQTSSDYWPFPTYGELLFGVK